MLKHELFLLFILFCLEGKGTFLTNSNFILLPRKAYKKPWREWLEKEHIRKKGEKVYEGHELQIIHPKHKKWLRSIEGCERKKHEH